MSQLNQSLNLPQLHRKGLHAVFGGIRAPYYYTTDVVREGQPVKLKATTATEPTDNYAVEDCASGASDGAKVIGLSLQDTYNVISTAPYDQIKNYHFAGQTVQQTNGMPVGVLMGQGWALLENYTGTISSGEQLGVGASGLLAGATNSGLASGDKVTAWAESASGTLASDSSRRKPVRIRFDFGFTTGNAA